MSQQATQRVSPWLTPTAKHRIYQARFEDSGDGQPSRSPSLAQLGEPLVLCQLGVKALSRAMLTPSAHRG